jgi:ribonuclease HI
VAIYHLSAKTGTRAGGQSASAKFDYLARRGKYSRQDDKLVHLVSGNMPAWAQRKPAAYWRAADQHERANARLFKELDVALPNELTHEQRVQLAEAFAIRVATVSAGPLPFTLALHEGAAKQPGEAGNPHLHLAMSERVNDGHDRDSSTWFKRSAVGKGKLPSDGGASKTDQLKPKQWLEDTRALWATMCNEALQKAGHQARIDHRSLAAQCVDRAPQIHLGPAAFGLELRTGQASRRRLEKEKQAAEDLAVSQALKKVVAQAQADADAAMEQARRMQQTLRAMELATAPTWAESIDGLDLTAPLPFPDTRPSAGPYLAKALPSGVVLHLRMPADQVAFVERQNRIRMAITDALDPESVAQAVEVACAKWGRIAVTGSTEFRRLVVEQALHLGLLNQLDGLTNVDQQYLSAATKRPRGPQ